jgi:DNA-binding protein Fis
MYDMVIGGREAAARGGDEQATATRAGAEWLGINRNTLRKKLRRTQLLCRGVTQVTACA